jgi:hypothetical protein
VPKISHEFLARIFDGRIKNNAAMNLFYQNRPASRQLSGEFARRVVSFHARGNLVALKSSGTKHRCSARSASPATTSDNDEICDCLHRGGRVESQSGAATGATLFLLRPGFAWFSFNGGLAATGAACR